MPDEMVIFTSVFDLLTWLLPRCDTFPKAQRFVVTGRLQGAALDLMETLYESNAQAGKRCMETLGRADAHLNKLRVYLRLAHEWGWLSSGQFEHVSRMVAEIGRLLGGWIRQAQG